MFGHRDRLAVLNPVDDRAGFVLEFPDPYGCFLHRGHILAKVAIKANQLLQPQPTLCGMVAAIMSKPPAAPRSVHLATIPIVLPAFLIGSPQGTKSHQARETSEPEPCPTWFYEAPRLGSGRPQAVELEDLKQVAVCRYRGNSHGAVGPDLPPNDKLVAEKVVDQRRTARSLARAFNRLRPYPFQDAPYPDGQPPMALCSAEFGGGFYLRFLYSDGRRSSVEVVPSGCPRAVPGKNGGWRLLSPDLGLRLMTIAPLQQRGD